MQITHNCAVSARLPYKILCLAEVHCAALLVKQASVTYSCCFFPEWHHPYRVTLVCGLTRRVREEKKRKALLWEEWKVAFWTSTVPVCACVCLSLSPSFSLSPSLPYSLSSLSSLYCLASYFCLSKILKTLNKSRQKWKGNKTNVSEAFEVFLLLVLYFSFAEKCHLNPRNSFKRSPK